jgi:hypothetical protein
VFEKRSESSWGLAAFSSLGALGERSVCPARKVIASSVPH